MTKRKTQIEFEKEVFDLVGNEYTVLSSYENSKEKILMQHNSINCDYYKWLVAPGHFVNDNSRCPKCYGNIKKTENDYEEKVKAIVGNEYSIINGYANAKTKVKFKHNSKECGYFEFEMLPNNFLHGQRCPLCQRPNYNRDTELFIQEVFDLTQGKYSVLGTYKGNKNRIRIRHNNIDCNNYEWNIAPDSFLRGARCPMCAGNMRKTTEQYIKEVNEISNEYLVKGDYKNTHSKIKMFHIICNNDFGMSPSDFISGRRCPICAESKGEQTIRKYCIDNNISYKSQYIFKDLKYKKYLRFDFAIFSDKEQSNLNCLIEYDGEFHFNPILGEKPYKYQKKLDKMKDDYCINNNLKLIRIPYWEYDNIENILQQNIV